MKEGFGRTFDGGHQRKIAASLFRNEVMGKGAPQEPFETKRKVRLVLFKAKDRSVTHHEVCAFI